MGRSLEERPLLPCGKEVLGKGDYEATAQLNELAVNPVMAELRELKADIYELNRSLDASSSIPGTGGLVGSIATGSFKSRPGSSSRPTPRYAHDSRQREHTLLKRLGGGQHDDAAGVSFSAPPFPPPAPPRDSRRRFDAAESRGSGVRADYSGARDAGQLVRRVEASARAVSLEKDDIIEALRAEEEETARLREALWQEGQVKRQWEGLTENFPAALKTAIGKAGRTESQAQYFATGASCALKRRLESTERIRLRQKELIGELQAVEADIAFASSTAGRAQSTSWIRYPPLTPPPLQPPPSPPLRVPGLVTGRKTKPINVTVDTPFSGPHHEARDEEPVGRGIGRRSASSETVSSRLQIRRRSPRPGSQMEGRVGNRRARGGGSCSEDRVLNHPRSAERAAVAAGAVPADCHRRRRAPRSAERAAVAAGAVPADCHRRRRRPTGGTDSRAANGPLAAGSVRNSSSSVMAGGAEGGELTEGRWLGVEARGGSGSGSGSDRRLGGGFLHGDARGQKDNGNAPTVVAVAPRQAYFAVCTARKARPGGAAVAATVAKKTMALTSRKKKVRAPDSAVVSRSSSSCLGMREVRIRPSASVPASLGVVRRSVPRLAGFSAPTAASSGKARRLTEKKVWSEARGGTDRRDRTPRRRGSSNRRPLASGGREALSSGYSYYGDSGRCRRRPGVP